jgi:hypothetical protein
MEISHTISALKPIVSGILPHIIQQTYMDGFLNQKFKLEKEAFTVLVSEMIKSWN